MPSMPRLMPWKILLSKENSDGLPISSDQKIFFLNKEILISELKFDFGMDGMNDLKTLYLTNLRAVNA